MEKFFTPTRRYQEIWEEYDDESPFEYTEVALAVPVEDLLVNRWDWRDLQAFLSGGATPKIIWITNNTFLVDNEGWKAFYAFFNDDGIYGCLSAEIEATSGEEQKLVLGQLDYYADVSTTGEFSVFWRAVATSNTLKLTLLHTYQAFGLPSGPVLSQFLRESPLLQVVEFDGFLFKEEHCRALATLQRTDLEIELTDCAIEPKNVEDAFIEWFRNNKVVTELVDCRMDSSILCALKGNNSVKKLTFDTDFVSIELHEEHMRSLAQAIAGNTGVEHLYFFGLEVSDEIWCLLFRSLATHPRIKLLDLNEGYLPHLSAESKTVWMNAIIQMLQRNTVVHTIELPDYFNNEALYLDSILPRLEMNRNCFEVQRQAVKLADPSLRPQLFGRALHVVRCNPELVFLFLSENVPSFVRTEEEDSAISLQNDPAIASSQKRKAPS
jgi:hypothetical protein